MVRNTPRQRQKTCFSHPVTVGRLSTVLMPVQAPCSGHVVSCSTTTGSEPSALEPMSWSRKPELQNAILNRTQLDLWGLLATRALLCVCFSLALAPGTFSIDNSVMCVNVLERLALA